MKRLNKASIYVPIVIVMLCIYGCGSNEEVKKVDTSLDTIEKSKEDETFGFDLEPEDIKKALHFNGLYDTGTPGSENNEKNTHEIKKENYRELCELINRINKVRYDEMDDRYIIRFIVGVEYAISVELIDGKKLDISYQLLEKDEDYYKMIVYYNDTLAGIYLTDEEWMKQWDRVLSIR